MKGRCTTPPGSSGRLATAQETRLRELGVARIVRGPKHAELSIILALPPEASTGESCGAARISPSFVHRAHRASKD